MSYTQSRICRNCSLKKYAFHDSDQQSFSLWRSCFPWPRPNLWQPSVFTRSLTWASSWAWTALCFSVSFWWTSFNRRLSKTDFSSRWLDDVSCCWPSTWLSLSRDVGMRCTWSRGAVASGFGLGAGSLAWLSACSCFTSRDFCCWLADFPSWISS